MDKKQVLEFVNQDKMAIGVCGKISKKVGVSPMYVRGGLVVASLFVNPLVGIVGYGAGYAYAYNKFKK